MATTDRNDKSLSDLRRNVARSRERLAHDVERFRDELDIPKKIRRSFQRQPVVWVAGLTLAGVAMVLLLARKRKCAPEMRGARAPKSNLLQAGFMLGALRIVANLIKPHVETFLAQKLRGYQTGPRQK